MNMLPHYLVKHWCESEKKDLNSVNVAKSQARRWLSRALSSSFSSVVARRTKRMTQPLELQINATSNDTGRERLTTMDWRRRKRSSWRWNKGPDADSVLSHEYRSSVWACSGRMRWTVGCIQTHTWHSNSAVTNYSHHWSNSHWAYNLATWGPIYKISYDNLTIMPKLRSTYESPNL